MTRALSRTVAQRFSRRGRRTGAFLLVGVAALSLTGCVSPLSAGDIASSEPRVSGLDDSGQFMLTTWGSSSCPRVVTGIEATGDASATVLLEPSAGEVCTADIAPTTHELTLPDEVTGRPVTITVTYSDWDETTELTLG